MLEEIYTKYGLWLTAWCRAMAGDEGEDVAQEAFLRAAAHLGEIEGMASSQVRAWLRRTARNIYIDILRRRRELPLEQAAEPGGEDDVSRELVAALCARLPEEERRLFTLRYFAGYNSRELGEMFSMPASTVRARLTSAREKLKKYYFED